MINFITQGCTHYKLRNTEGERITSGGVLIAVETSFRGEPILSCEMKSHLTRGRHRQFSPIRRDALLLQEVRLWVACNAEFLIRSNSYADNLSVIRAILEITRS